MKQKVNLKLLIFSIVVICITAVLMFACNNNSATQYSIEYIAQTGGSITGELIQQVKHGEDGARVVAIPDEGYEFVKWSDGKTENERLESNVTENRTFIAEFRKSIYTIQYEAQIGGRITGILIQNVKFGENGTQVIAIPDVGYEFVKWSDGKTEPERTETTVTENNILTAQFEKTTYTVEYQTKMGGSISGKAIQSVKFGESGTEITAVPDIGYEFVKWSDGVKTATRLDESIVADISVEAEFKCLFAGGKGILTDPFLIENYSEFMNIRKYPEYSYKLIEDLNLDGINHIQLFTNRNLVFNGEFDGNNHYISNLYVNNDFDYPSLFGIIGINAEIHNLRLINFSIYAKDYDTSIEQYCVGSIAGLAMGGVIADVICDGVIHGSNLYHDQVAIGGLVGWNCAHITRVDVDVEIEINNIERKYITNKTYPFCIGGFAGIAMESHILDCKIISNIKMDNDLKVDNNDVNIGGFIGVYLNSNNSTEITTIVIDNICVTTNINNNMQEIVGGFIARVIHGNSSSITFINNCIVGGQITSISSVAGFIYVTNGDIRMLNCSSMCNLNGTGRVAGFIYQAQNTSLEACTYKGNIISSGYASGFCHTIVQSMLSQCYVDINMSAYYAYAFIFNVGKGSIVEQCFCAGQIIVLHKAVGLLGSTSSSIISNCYTEVNMVVNLIEATDARIYTFIERATSNSLVENCCVYGDIMDENNSGIEVFILSAFINSDVENCHILQNSFLNLNRLTINETNNTDRTWLNLYQNITDMFNLAEVLNFGGDIIWIDLEGQVTKLLFQKI